MSAAGRASSLAPVSATPARPFGLLQPSLAPTRRPAVAAFTARRHALFSLAGSAAAAAAGGGSSPATAAVPSPAATPAAAAPPSVVRGTPPPTELDASGMERLALQEEGWESWTWRSKHGEHRVNWLCAGPDDGPAVVLVHGFGASAYHYRYSVPSLAAGGCKVYALCMLGFGWSDKSVIEYDGYEVWADQIADFCRQVVGLDRPVTLVGNSLGGYSVVAAAALHEDLRRAADLVLLNSAGRFDVDSPEDLPPDAPAEAAAGAAAVEGGGLLARIWEPVAAALRRGVVAASFIFTKQPARIRQVLRQVYVNHANVDEQLVRSIALPADHPNAPEVFYRVITGRGAPMNRLLARLEGTPLLLLWGASDPWCVPARASQIQRFYPTAQRIDLPSGHCPHDDTPQLVNENLLRWITQQRQA